MAERLCERPLHDPDPVGDVGRPVLEGVDGARDRWLRSAERVDGRRRGKARVERTLDLRPGEMVGFIGPNGAGKTTTYRCIVGLLLVAACGGGEPEAGGEPFTPKATKRSSQ